MSVEAICNTCERIISPQHTGPCSFCGHTGKSVYVGIQDSITIQDSVSARVTLRDGLARICDRVRTSTNRKTITLSCGGTVALATITYFVGGEIGLAISLIAGLLFTTFGSKMYEIIGHK